MHSSRIFRFNQLIALSYLVCTPVHGDTSSSRLQVQIPADLFKSSGYDHQEALFGIPPYGGSLVQRLLYPKNESAESYELCKDSDTNGFSNPSPDQPFILMIDRGGQDCTFVSKVRRAQHLGASGVIIADDRCLCSDSRCSGGRASCQMVEPIMADDGSGSSITIPSFLITKPDADLLKKRLSQKQFIQIEMTWNLPAPDDRVEWSMWTSGLDVTSISFKKEFKDIVNALGKHAYFTPYYTIYDGVQYGCDEDPTLCGNLCTNSGRYCYPDPDWNPDSGISGADVITETLRQKCVWLYYGGEKAPSKDQGIGIKWWTYVERFNTLCGISKFTDKSCISSAMSDAEVDELKIKSCMDESGGLNSDIDNTILNSELKERIDKSIIVMPTVYVNNVVERGGITPVAVLNTICSGYADGTQPAVCNCYGLGSTEALRLCASNNGNFTTSTGSVSLATVFWVVIFTTFILGSIGFFYYRKSQENMREQVRGILAEYMPLDDMDIPSSNMSRVPFLPPNASNGVMNTYPKYKPPMQVAIHCVSHRNGSGSLQSLNVASFDEHIMTAD